MTNEESRDSLLGNDFLHHCSYAHCANGDIVIESFDIKSYETYFEKITSNDLKHQSLDLRLLIDELDLLHSKNSLYESGAKLCFPFLNK